MKKEAVIHLFNKFKEDRDFEDIDIDCIEIYLDVTTEPDLLKKIIGTNAIKFKLIIRTILSGEYNEDLYKKEADNVYAMRFSSPNSRIYCQEIHNIGTKKKIIMSRGVPNKTSQKNNKTNKPIIEAVEKYEFNFLKKYENTEKYKSQQGKP